MAILKSAAPSGNVNYGALSAIARGLEQKRAEDMERAKLRQQQQAEAMQNLIQQKRIDVMERMAEEESKTKRDIERLKAKEAEQRARSAEEWDREQFDRTEDRLLDKYKIDQDNETKRIGLERERVDISKNKTQATATNKARDEYVASQDEFKDARADRDIAFKQFDKVDPRSPSQVAIAKRAYLDAQARVDAVAKKYESAFDTGAKPEPWPRPTTPSWYERTVLRPFESAPADEAGAIAETPAISTATRTTPSASTQPEVPSSEIIAKLQNFGKMPSQRELGLTRSGAVNKKWESERVRRRDIQNNPYDLERLAKEYPYRPDQVQKSIDELEKQYEQVINPDKGAIAAFGLSLTGEEQPQQNMQPEADEQLNKQHAGELRQQIEGLQDYIRQYPNELKIHEKRREIELGSKINEIIALPPAKNLPPMEFPAAVPVGFVEQLRAIGRNVEDYIPFTPSETLRLYELNLRASRLAQSKGKAYKVYGGGTNVRYMSAGEKRLEQLVGVKNTDPNITTSEEDKDWINNYLKEQEFARRPKNWKAKFLDGVAILPKWGIEYGLTAALSGGTPMAKIRSLTDSGIKVGLLKKLGIYGATAIEQTMLQPHNVAAAIAERQKPNIRFDDKGIINITPSKETPIRSTLMGIGGVLVENLSESLGDEAINALAKTPVLGGYIRKMADVTGVDPNTPGWFGKTLRNMGVTSLPGESLEERFATLGHALIGDETFGLPEGSTIRERIFAGLQNDLHNLGIEILILSVPTIGGGVLSKVIGQPPEAKTPSEVAIESLRKPQEELPPITPEPTVPEVPQEVLPHQVGEVAPKEVVIPIAETQPEVTAEQAPTEPPVTIPVVAEELPSEKQGAVAETPKSELNPDDYQIEKNANKWIVKRPDGSYELGAPDQMKLYSSKVAAELGVKKLVKNAERFQKMKNQNLTQRGKDVEQYNKMLAEIQQNKGRDFNAEYRKKYASIIGKIFTDSEGLWRLDSFNDAGIPYFNKIVKGKPQKKLFTIRGRDAKWAEEQLQKEQQPAPETTEEKGMEAPDADMPMTMSKIEHQAYRANQPIHRVVGNYLKMGDRILHSSGEIYTVTKIENGKIYLQDGKKRVINLADNVEIVGNINDPILTGHAGGKTFELDEPTEGFSDLEKKLVSQTFTTLKDKQHISDVVAAEIEARGLHTYTPIPVEITQKKAKEYLDTEGYDNVSSMVYGGKASLSQTQREALGQALVTHWSDEHGAALRNGAPPVELQSLLDKEIEEASRFMFLSGDTGRALQILSQTPVVTRPEWWVRMATRAMDSVSKKKSLPLRKPVQDIQSESKQVIQEAKEGAIDDVAEKFMRAQRKKAKTRRTLTPKNVEDKSAWALYEDFISNRVLKSLGEKDPKPPLRDTADRILKNVMGRLPKDTPTIDKRAAFGLVRDLIKNKDKYAETLGIIEKDLTAEIDAVTDEIQISKLSDVLDIVREIQAKPIDEKRTTNVVDEVLREFSINLGSVVKLWMRNQVEIGQALRNYLSGEGKFTVSEFDEFDKLFMPAYRQRLEQVRQKTLDNWLKRIQTPGKPRAKKSFIQSLWQMINLGVLDDAKYFDIVKKTLGLQVYDPTILREVIRRANELQHIPQQFKRNDKIAEIANYIADQLPSNKIDAVTGLLYAFGLSGYQTHMVNFGMTGLNTFIRTIGNILMNPRPSDIKVILSGLFEGLSRGMATARTALAGKETDIGQSLKEGFDFSKGMEGGYWERVKNPMFTWIKYVRRAMIAEDAVWNHGNYEMEAHLLANKIARSERLRGDAFQKRVSELLHEDEIDAFKAQATGEGLTGLDHKRRVSELIEEGRDELVRKDAKTKSLDTTFNTKEATGPLGYIARGIAYMTQNVPLLKVVAPFTRIVANVLNYGLEFTPVGYWRSFWTRSGGEHSRYQGEAQTHFANAVMGSLFISSVLALILKYKDDPDPPFDVSGRGAGDRDRNAILAKTGWKPYSVYWKGRWWSYADSSLALGLAWVGNIKDAMKYGTLSDKSASKRATAALFEAPRVVLSMGFMKGPADFIRSITQPSYSGSALGGVANKVGSIFVPKAVSSIDKIFNPKIYEDDSIIEGALRNLPGARSRLKPIITVLGDPLYEEKTLGERAFGRFYSVKKESDPAYNFLAKHNVWPSTPSKNTQVIHGTNNTVRDITPEEYYNYVLISGKEIKSGIMTMISDGMGNEKEEVIKDRLDDIVTRARLNALHQLDLGKKNEYNMTIPRKKDKYDRIIDRNGKYKSKY